ncbi:MAG: hypothetical protein D6717_05175 [Gammaproteobacteria bacterium]|nr:MAG: hypothetical protein D6717_05175 [Gammaproteobacteria bacterium]
MSIFNHKVFIGLTVKLSAEDAEQHMAASPRVVGRQLAEAVDAHVREHALGYYPPLDYFRGSSVLDEELLDAAENMGWLVSRLVREELGRRLRAVFSRVSFQTVQTVAFSMPSVRPGQKDALERLAEHYTPTRVRVDLEMSLIQKRPNPEGLEHFARSVLLRWVEPAFEEVEVTSVHLIE